MSDLWIPPKWSSVRSWSITNDKDERIHLDTEAKEPTRPTGLVFEDARDEYRQVVFRAALDTQS